MLDRINEWYGALMISLQIRYNIIDMWNRHTTQIPFDFENKVNSMNSAPQRSSPEAIE